ncbi:MAG: hypothetical protein Q9217_006973 [Psora testacea]
MAFTDRADACYFRTLCVCVVLRALATFSSAISQVPRLRLLEANVCRTFYRLERPDAIDSMTDTVAESLCKNGAVQGQLSFLLGWNVLFQNVPVLVVGLIYAALTSRVERKVLLFVNVSSNALAQLYFYSVCFFYDTFDVRFIWLASLFDLVGGGKVVFDTLTVSMIAETVPAASLSAVYFYLNSGLTALRMVGVSGGSFLLRKGYWVPLSIGLGAWSLTLPTTLSLQRKSRESYQSILNQDNMEHRLASLPNEDITSDSGFGSGSADEHARASTPKIKRSRQSSVESLTSDIPRLSWMKLLRTTLTEAFLYKLPLIVFLTHEMSMGVRDIAEQWISKRFSLPFQKVGYILAGQTLLSAIILSMLPRLSNIIAHNYDLTTAKKDLFVTRASALAAATGSILIAVCWNVALLLGSFAVFAFGVGFHDAMKSYVAFRVGTENTEKLTKIYMLISILEVFANMLNGPLWATIYTLAMRTGEIGMALPFVLCVIGFLATWFLARKLD